MGCGTSFVKYVLFFFNLLFALVGIAMIGIGVAVLLNWAEAKNALEGTLTGAPWVFIVIGSIVFVIAFFGCCGAIRESHCMVVTYAIFLLVIIIVQVGLAVILFVYSTNIEESMIKSVNTLFNKKQGGDAAAETAFTNLELQLQCCGGNGASDYGSLKLPPSCCSGSKGFINTAINTCTFADANEGCATKLSSLYKKWNHTIAGVAIGVACVEVIGAVFALCLANSIRNMDRRYA